MNDKKIVFLGDLFDEYEHNEELETLLADLEVKGLIEMKGVFNIVVKE